MSLDPQALLQKRIDFSQDQPRIGNQYTEDEALLKYINIFLEGNQWSDTQAKDLQRFGAKVASRQYLNMSADAERNKPSLESQDGWGRRLDLLHTSEGWKYLKREAAIEHLIALPYVQNAPVNARIHQILKLYLFAPSSGLVSCPLAMTDGAAYTLRELKRQDSRYFTKEIEDAYNRLTATDPNKFWTSGQWMTEKKGGSDVTGGTETFAIEKNQSSNVSPRARRERTPCSLYGYKWFSSATDADMSLALARFPIDQQELEKNTGKLGLVFVKMRDNSGNLNNIQIVRLKDKLGTRQLPTAELILNGTQGIRISERGKGVKTISSMLNITRVHNSISALSGMRRIISLAADYMHRRFAFGSLISKKSLQIQIVAQMELAFRGNLLFLLEMSRYLQEQDNNNNQNADLFRQTTSALKVFTAKECMWLVSEGLECFGGLGYLENSHLPKIFRDSQVLPIWEGTTNVLALDFVKSLAKDYALFKKIFLQFTTGTEHLKTTHPQHHETYQKHVTQFIQDLEKSLQSGAHNVESNARILVFNYSYLFITTIIIKKIVPAFAGDDQESALLDYWIYRLEKESKPIHDQSKLAQTLETYSKFINRTNLGKDIDTEGVPRSRL